MQQQQMGGGIPMSESQVLIKLTEIFNELDKNEQDPDRKSFQNFCRDNYEHSKFIVKQFETRYKIINVSQIKYFCCFKSRFNPNFIFLL